MSTAGIDKAQANNFLAVEGELVRLLQAAVASHSRPVAVLTAAQLSGLNQTRQTVPALHIIYGGPYRIAGNQGTRLLLHHTWHVVVVDTHVGTPRSGQQARQEVAPLVVQVMGALSGAAIAGTTRPAALVQPPAPWYEAGTLYFPVSIQVETVFHT